MDKVLRDQIAGRLKALQRVAGATDDEMASYVGISRTAWANATSLGGGKKVNKPSEEAMIRLCEKAGLTMEWIYRGDDAGIPHAVAQAIEVELARETPQARRGNSIVVRLPGLRASVA